MSCRAAASLAMLAAACGDNLAAFPVDGNLVFRFEQIQLPDAPQAITEIAWVPGKRELLVLNKTHTVTHYALDDGATTATLLGSFAVPGVDETADCGLLSVAFDPDFATNRLIYFGACESFTHSRITQHQFDPADYGSIERTTAVVISAGDPAADHAWHNIGSIGFTADKELWAVFGDKTIPGNAQDLTTPLGKAIRIVPDRTGVGGFTPAPHNPFAGMTDRDQSIVAAGFRSPWRAALDDQGRLWVGDVGNTDFEELNISRFAAENFGAGIAEGPCLASCDGLVDPVIHWGRESDHPYVIEDPLVVPAVRRTIWLGGTYPRTVEVDRYAGRMFDRMLVGDFAAGWIRLVGIDETGAVIHDKAAGHLEAGSSWSLGPDGYLYASTYGSSLAWPYKTGAVYRAIAIDE
jgi:hypothetical protein